MNLENYYWYFDKAIGNYYCDPIINYALKQNKDIILRSSFDNTEWKSVK